MQTLNRPIPLLLLAVGLAAVSFVAGCFASRSVADARAGQDPQPALAEVKAAIEHQNWQAGHDALLVALRISPGNENVFDTGCKFIEEAALGDENAKLSALAVQQRLDSAIPYLPLHRVPTARKRITDLGNKLLPPDTPDSNGSPPRGDPFATVDQLLKAASSTNTPLKSRVRQIQGADEELSSLCKGAATGSPIDWEKYKERIERHDKCQKELTAALFKDARLQEAIEKWNNDVKAFIAECDKDGGLDPEKRDQEASKLVVEGHKLSRGLTPYLDAEVQGAINLASNGKIDSNIGKLVRAREWVYNRWVVAHIVSVDTDTELKTDLDHLKSLSLVDEGRLVPYVSEMFASNWKKWFDKCGSDDQLEATKFRIMRGAK